MPHFRVDTRLTWSFSTRAGIGHPHRSPVANRLVRAAVLRTLVRAAARRGTPRTVPARRRRHLRCHGR